MNRTLVLTAALAAGGGVAAAALLAANSPTPQAVVAAATSAQRAAQARTPEPSRGSVAPQAVRPLAEVKGNIAGTELGLLSLRRGGPKVLVVRVRMTASRKASAFELNGLDLAGSGTSDVSGMELRDQATGRAMVPAVKDGRCDCSDFPWFTPGDRIELGATFRMPSATGPFVLRVPGFPEIAGITPGD